MSIEVKNSVQETIKNLEAQEQTPETAESIRALKEAFNTEVTESVTEFKAEDGEVEKIEKSVKLNNPESIKEIEREMKVEETLQGFDTEVETLKNETLENEPAPNPDWKNTPWEDIFKNDDSIWEKGYIDENTSPEEKLFYTYNSKILDMLLPLKYAQYLTVEQANVTNGSEQAKEILKRENLENALGQVDFALIKEVLNSNYKYNFFEKYDELEKSLQHNSISIKIKDYMADGLSKIVKDNPSIVSIEDFLNNAKKSEYGSASMTYEDNVYYLNSVLEGASEIYKDCAEKIDNPAVMSDIANTMKHNFEHIDPLEIVDNHHLYPESLASIYQISSPETQEKMIDIIHEKVLSGSESDAYSLLFASSDFIKINAEVVVEKKIKDEFGVADFNLSAWKGNGIKLHENLKIMSQLEKSEPGAVKKLVEDYGIMEFHRYPTELLLAQIKEENIQQPYGIVIYPRHDHNNAFDNEVPMFKKLFQDTRGHYGVKVAECESKYDLARRFISLDGKYGKENKISFIVMGGHGSGDSLRLGQDRINNSPRNSVFNVESANPGFKKANQKYLDKDAEIILMSCSVGQKDGVAQKLSDSFEKKTMAPTIPVSNLELDLRYDINGKPHFKAIYDNNEEISATFGESKAME